MNKYLIEKYEGPIPYVGVKISLGNDAFTMFAAEVGNPSYDQFLVDTNLTDKKVQALTPDKWYDFPKAD